MKKDRRGTVNEHLLHRIDSMVEEDLYEPYKSVRKNVINNDELFGEGYYNDKVYQVETGGEDESNDVSSLKPLLIFFGVMVVVLGILFIIVENM